MRVSLSISFQNKMHFHSTTSRIKCSENEHTSRSLYPSVHTSIRAISEKSVVNKQTASRGFSPGIHYFFLSKGREGDRARFSEGYRLLCKEHKIHSLAYKMKSKEILKTNRGGLHGLAGKGLQRGFCTYGLHWKTT